MDADERDSVGHYVRAVKKISSPENETLKEINRKLWFANVLLAIITGILIALATR